MKQMTTFFLSVRSYKWYQTTEKNNCELMRTKISCKALYD